MKTRLKDVAEHLNLSSALVSGILNRRENVWASAETRARVFRAARELNYGDYPTERAARAAAPLDVLLVGEVPGAPAFVAALAREGAVSLFRFPDMAGALGWAATRPSAPAVLLGDPAEVAGLAAALAPPFVAVESEDPGRGAAVGFDYAAMAVGTIDHLGALGHRRVARLGEGPAAFREGLAKRSRSVLGAEPVPVAATEAEIEAALSGPDAPTAWAVAEPGAWSLLEACLSRRGARLGFASGTPAAAGLHDGCPLALGQALVHDLGAGATPLAQAALAALRGEEGPRRVALRLTRATTFAHLPESPR